MNMNTFNEESKKLKPLVKTYSQLDKFGTNSSEDSSSKAMRPIVQSYKVTPSFAQNNSTRNSGVRNYGPIRTINPNSFSNNFPKTVNSYRHNRNSQYPVRHMALRPVFKNSLTKWIRPVNILGTIINGAANSVISEDNSNSTNTKIDNVTNEIPNSLSNTIGLAFIVPQQIVDGVSKDVGSKVPCVTSSLSGPLKPIVQLNNKHRFRLKRKGFSSKAEVKKVNSSKDPIVKISTGTTTNSMYKLDRRALPYQNKLGLGIARNTLISGLSLSQRRSSLTAYAHASLQSRFLLKCNPYVRKNLSQSFTIVRQYSLKRIRKSSIQLAFSPLQPKSKGRQKLINKNRVNYGLKNQQNDLDVTQGSQGSQSSQLELSSLSLSQNPSIRRATRVVQRLRQRLSASKRKTNTFCVFYNRCGICKRKDDGKCPFIHDPRQLRVCNKFLNSGKCELPDCKLSHTLTEGKIPSCRFFNETMCSRENCRYRHVVSSPKKHRRSSKPGLISRIHKELKTPKTTNTLDGKILEKVEEKARYFEISPDSQPVVAIIPRRYPKGLIDNDCLSTESSHNQQISKEINYGSDENEYDSKNESSESVSVSLSGGSDKSDDVPLVNEPNDLKNSKRERLLERVRKLKTESVVEKTTSGSAPLYLAFKPRLPNDH